ncbi:MAG: glycosyltransferase [Betaproteobacteria bacterium]
MKPLRAILDNTPKAPTPLIGAIGALGLSHSFIATNSSPAEQRDLDQRTRINISFGAGCEYRHAVGQGLTERHFGAPACGGFLLSDRRLHAAAAFEAGREWAEFDRLEEPLQQIAHFLAHFSAARAMLAAIDAWRLAHRKAA